MKDNTITKNEIEKAMCDLRKAHRLIFEYQNRMLQLMFYIRNKFSLPNEIAGYKRFSNPISKTRYYNTEYPQANLKIMNGMWAWDFIYSYEFEYHFGSTVDKKLKKEFSLSVIQVSDSGYYESSEHGKSQTDTKSFTDCEDSSSALIFVFEAVPNNKKSEYSWEIDKTITTLLSSDKKREIKQNNGEKSYVACKYGIHKFFNQATTDKVLEDFSVIVKEQSGINLIK